MPADVAMQENRPDDIGLKSGLEQALEACSVSLQDGPLIDPAI